LTAQYATSATTVTYENVYADIAAQIGLAGALLFGAMLVAAIRSMISPIRAVSWEQVQFPTAAVLGMLVLGGLFASQLLVVTSIGPLWVLVGALVAQAPIKAGIDHPGQAQSFQEAHLANKSEPLAVDTSRYGEILNREILATFEGSSGEVISA
jgi:O-antigen ligase